MAVAPPQSDDDAKSSAATKAVAAPKESGALEVDDAKASGALSARAPRRRGPVRRLRAWLRRQGRQSVEALRERDGLAWAWAAVLLLALFSYLLDLGSGSIWNGDDARFAWETQRLAARDVVLGEAARVLPAPTGAPLALWQFMTAVQLFGSGDAALRLLPALSGLACAFCLLTIAIDVGVGRHAGGLGSLLLLALPLTYELSHRVLPDMMIAFAGTLSVALWSHALHGHRFDRHILPHHGEEEAPAPLPLRRTPMAMAAAGIGLCTLLSRRAAVMALLAALFDVLLVNRYLIRKRRVWVALLSGAALILLTARSDGLAGFGGLSGLRSLSHLGKGALRALGRPELRDMVAAMQDQLLNQDGSRYGRIAGRVLVGAGAFGVLVCLIRRVSRPLPLWLLAASAMTLLSTGDPRRGVALLLPPLALCAAVGLETPVRWLGRLGNLVTLAAVAGIVAAWFSGAAALHRDDTVRALAQSQRRAPAGTLLCTVGMPPYAAMHYTRRPVVAYKTAADLAAALGKDQPLSCMMPASEREAVARALLGERAGAAAVKRAERGGRGRRGTAAQEAAAPPPLGSVLATVLDIEEPPPDTLGPQVVLVNR